MYLYKLNTSAGVDDVLAMLLALAAKPEELEVLMLSISFGNVQVQRYQSNNHLLPIEY